MIKYVSGIVPQGLPCIPGGHAQGEILMVHTSAVYFTLGEDVYLLYPRRFGAAPIGIGISDFGETAAVMGLAPGQPIFLENHALCTPGGRMILRTEEYSEAAVSCVPAPEKCRQAARTLTGLDKKTGFSSLAGPLLLGIPMDIPAQASCRRALPTLAALLRGIIRTEQDTILRNTLGLLGLGTGLTPSGDDVLLGLLFGLGRSSLASGPAVKWLTEAVRSHAPLQTNRISSAYLKAICSGMPFARLEQAWLGLDCRFPSGVHDLLEIGSNSGSEMLLGLLLAARCLEAAAPD